MDDPNVSQWKKELKLLLDQIQTQPSQDSAEKRERINVLNQLIASRTPETTGA